MSPVRATLSVNQSVAALTVRNDGAAPTVVQLEVLSWSQLEGKDVYTPTREILATPPIFTVAPGRSQVVRVGLRRAPDSKRELTYRLFLQEVPPPPAPGFQGLQVALRVGLPVFVVPPVGAKPMLRWRAYRAQGQSMLNLTNDGNAHIQIANFTLGASGRDTSETYQVATYVLPGQSRDWPVKLTMQPGASLSLRANTDDGEAKAELVVEAP